MYPILGRYGSFFLYSYTVVLLLGVVASWGLAWWRLAKRPFVLDLFVWWGGTAIVAGRLGFVLGQWSYFSQRPAESWQLWQGGLSYHGALLGGLLGLWLWTRRHKLETAVLLPALTPSLVLLHLFGWGACLLEGCGYGETATLGLLTADLPDTFGVYALRYQTQLLGLFGTGALFLFTLRQPSFWLALALISSLHAGLSLLRGDAALYWGGWRLDTVLSLTITLIALFLLQYKHRK